MKKIDIAQEKLDNLDYPPTHTYNIETVEASGVLAERMDIINKVAPGFFTDMESLLDIGCNKGFFSMLAAKNAKRVVSIDTDERFTELCKSIKPAHMHVEQTGFRDFIPDDEFDRVFIGNVHHYIFKESNGWDWVAKLAAICTKEVLIEGPVDMTCKDMPRVFKDVPELTSEFNYDKFLHAMERFFVLKKKVASYSYTPDRYVMLFEKKDDLFQKNRVDIADIGKGEVLKKGSGGEVLLADLDKFDTKVIVKTVKNPNPSLKMSVAMSRFSPISNGAIGSIYDGETFVGWIEEYNDSKIYRYFENEKALFLRICDNNIFLARLGYFDTDVATINFFKDTNQIFDKGLVMPARELSTEVYESFQGKSQGYYFIHLNNSFSIIDNMQQENIYQAMKSKDSREVESVFQSIKNNLREISFSGRRQVFKPFILKVGNSLAKFTPFLMTRFEDFYPISDTEALIVTGIHYAHLSHIRKVRYKLSGQKVIISFFGGETLATGNYVRLGNYYNDKLIYSDVDSVFSKQNSKIAWLGRGVQPYLFDGGLLTQINGSIFLDNKEIIRPWDGYSIVGRPMYSEGWIYFETRQGPAPTHWEVWRHELTTNKKERVLEHGANPYIYGEKLFYSLWSDGRFITKWIDKPKATNE